MHIRYEDYVEHSKLAFKNRALLDKSKTAACYYCYAKCDTKDIEYTDDDTGICPACGIDTVLPDSLPIDNNMFLKHMHFYGFDHIVMSNGKDTVRKYHSASECMQCCFVNYLEHINEVLPVNKIVIKDLKGLGGPCPWQWEGVTSDGREVYIRERHRILRIDLGDVVYLLMKDIEFDGYEDLVRLTGNYVTYPSAAKLI